MDCELADDGDPFTQPSASATACGKVREKYLKLKGEDLPCRKSCPCFGAGLQAWDAVGSACQEYRAQSGEACEAGCAAAGPLWGVDTACSVWNNSTCDGPTNWCGVWDTGAGKWTMIELRLEQAMACDAALQQACTVE